MGVVQDYSHALDHTSPSRKVLFYFRHHPPPTITKHPTHNNMPHQTHPHLQNMVVLQVKRADGDSFLYETTCQTKNEDLLQDLVWVWNARLSLQRLVGLVRALLQGDGGGDRMDDNLTSGQETLLRVALDAEAYLGTTSTTQGGGGGGAAAGAPPPPPRPQHAMSRLLLQEKLENFRGAVALAFPSFSSSSATRTSSSSSSSSSSVEKEDASPTSTPKATTTTDEDGGVTALFRTLSLHTKEESATTGSSTTPSEEEKQEDPLRLDPATAQLWAMGKEFARGQTVGERLGGSKNEKTKVVVKLNGPGKGPPVREPVVREEERQAMLAHYFKRQEELKKLAEAEDDDYMHAGWADGKQLQRGLQGVGDVKAPGFGGLR